MSLLGRTIARIIPVALESLPKCALIATSRRVPSLANTALARSFSCLSSSSSSKVTCHHGPCSCHCNGLHTKGDKELADFLQEEITAEKKNLVAAIPRTLGQFDIKTEKSQITLTRKFNNESITISLDVNHTVDAESPAQVTEDEQAAELKSRPSFEVDIKQGDRTMSFTCSFIAPEDSVDQDQQQQQQQQQDTIEDTFGINELTIYDGEWTEETYCVSGDILDSNLYNLLMNYLDERGVSMEFAEKLSDLCSDYEHSLYVGLLQKVQDFIKRA